MNYMKQFAIIMAVTCAAEGLYYILPFSIPPGIYGLCIMLGLLVFKIIKIEQVKEVSTFLIQIMPLMFIPIAVGIMVSWSILEPVILPVIVIILLSTVIVMAASGIAVNMFIGKGEGK